MNRFVSRTIIIGAASLALAPLAAGAQILKRPQAPKTINYVGASVGITQGYTLLDGRTNASWRFGSGLEYAARFEHPTKSGFSFGVQAAYAKMPLSYSSPACTCDATAAVTQFLGIAHYGSGYAFHGIYELSAGFVGYSNFRRSDDQTPELGSSGTDYDFKISIGYGLGFGLSPRTSVEVIQEIGTLLHQREGLTGSESNYPRVYVTRIGGKFSF